MYVYKPVYKTYVAVLGGLGFDTSKFIFPILFFKCFFKFDKVITAKKKIEFSYHQENPQNYQTSLQKSQ